ncbi:MAG: glycosyltransferase [Pseudomonadota bacterium]
MTDDVKRIHDNENITSRGVDDIRSGNSVDEAPMVANSDDGRFGPKERTAIVVLGMHRSGTSALTRVLSILRAALPETIMGASEGNDLGHWEPTRLMEYNDRLFKDLRTTWYDWTPLDLTRLSMRERTRLEDDWAEIIEQEFSNASTIVIKEPRLSRMSDSFLKAMEANSAKTVSIIPLRNPLDVIESLQARSTWPAFCDRMDASFLWLSSMLQVEKAARYRPHAFVAYEDLLSQPIETLERLMAKVDLPELRDPDSVREELLEFIDPDLRNQRNRPGDVALDPELGGWVSDAYSALRRIASGIDVEQARSEIDEISVEFNKALPLLKRSAQSRREAWDEVLNSKTLRKDYDNLAATHAKTIEKLKHERKSLREVTRDLNSAAKNLERLKKTGGPQAQTLRKKLAQLRTDNQSLQDTLKQERADKDYLAQQKRELEDAIIIRSTSIESLQSRVSQLLEEQSALDNHIASVRSAASKNLADIEERYRREIAERDSALETLKRQLSAIDEDSRTTRARFTQSQAELNDLRNAVEIADQELADSAAEIKAIEKRAAKLDRSNKDRKSQIKQLKKDRSSVLAQIADLETEKQTISLSTQEELRVLDERASSLERRLRDSESSRLDEGRRFHDKVAQIKQRYQSSTSWRLTAPFRGIVNFFKGTKPEEHYTPQGPSLITRGKKKASRMVKAVDQRVFNRQPKADPVPLGQLTQTGSSRQTLRLSHNTQVDPDFEPEISIIIPVYNNVEYTRACLESIAKAGSNFSYEILIGDDGSSDETETEMSLRRDLTYIRNDTNLGFLRNCNNAAQYAKGRYLVFLNNDTTVTPGWLDALRNTYDEHDDVGLVGSKLVYPNGQLQEAGGIVWEDGSGWNWGRLADPDNPKFNYVRDVDYVSGASIMIERDYFERLGRFDERYEMAYYEDTDLAMSVRASGRRVLYQPHSEVIHHEGISSGTDLESGQKQYQVSNAKLFFEKWRDELSSNLENASDPVKASDRTVKSHILIIDECTPTPDQDSGSIDMFNMIKILISLGYRVHFIPRSNFAFFDDYTRTLQGMGVECVYAPFYKSVEEFLTERGDMFSHVFLVRVTAAREYLETVKTHCPSAKRVFYTVDLHHLREKREAELRDDDELREIAAATEASEIGLMKDVSTTIVLSEAEKQMLEDRGVNGLVTIPLIREIERPTEAPFARRHGALFIGGYQHTPNIDAVKWLVDDIWPAVRKLTKERGLASVPLHIYGSRMPDSFRNFAAEDIHVHGFAPDLREIYNSVRLSVAPLRFGAGLKGKLATSFIYGVPVVGTDIAFEGVNNATLLAGSSSPDKVDMIAAHIVETHFMQEKWQRIRAASIDYANDQYSTGGVTKRIIKALET